MRENYKYLKNKNIICSIDNYKINNNGHIIILEKSDKNKEKKNKLIPFKSYIWLFKTMSDNIIKLDFIPNYIYNINLLQLNYKNIVITDANIKKNININETSIILENNFNDISSFSSNELKYITYKKIKLFELNEKILYQLKKFIIDKYSLYSNIFEKIFANKYTHQQNKIILLINFKNKVYPSFKIIEKMTDYNSIINKYKTNKDLKKFIINNS
jgi:hypothetical protein